MPRSLRGFVIPLYLAKYSVGGSSTLDVQILFFGCNVDIDAFRACMVGRGRGDGCIFQGRISCGICKLDVNGRCTSKREEKK